MTQFFNTIEPRFEPLASVTISCAGAFNLSCVYSYSEFTIFTSSASPIKAVTEKTFVVDFMPHDNISLSDIIGSLESMETIPGLENRNVSFDTGQGAIFTLTKARIRKISIVPTLKAGQTLEYVTFNPSQQSLGTIISATDVLDNIGIHISKIPLPEIVCRCEFGYESIVKA